MHIIHLEPAGPKDSGLVPLDLDPADFQSDLPEQCWHIYYENAELGLTVGVWTTTPMQETFGPYPGDEFMRVLEGNIVIVDEAGNETIVKEGETFLVRSGASVSWKQDGFCRKFFMTYLPPEKPLPELNTASGNVLVLRAADLEDRLKSSKSKSGVLQSDAAIFTNHNDKMSAGMWETDTFETAMEPFETHEFAQMLSGNVTITEASGTKHQFGSGDCFFVPAGTVCSWKADAPFRKFYCSLSPTIDQ